MNEEAQNRIIELCQLVNNPNQHQVNSILEKSGTNFLRVLHYTDEQFIELYNYAVSLGQRLEEEDETEIMQQASEDIKQGLTAINESLTALSDNIISREITEAVPKYDGLGTQAQFQKWIKEMRRQKRLRNLNDTNMRYLTTRTVRGSASDYIARLLTANPNITWESLQKRDGGSIF
jgi:hypothetical protein